MNLFLADRKSQKSTKSKKKMVLSGIFRKASGKLNSSPRSNSLSEGKIFGHPLIEICDPDLPVPVMVCLLIVALIADQPTWYSLVSILPNSVSIAVNF